MTVHPLRRHPIRTPGQLVNALQIPFSDEQLSAITAPLEPAVIIAGAGSGKTTVMAARVVWLVGTGQVRPDQVLGLTFTRKAAAELAARVAAALDRAGVLDGQEGQGAELVMTYDSFAARLVGEFGIRVGIDREPVMITGASRFRLATRVVANAPGPFRHLSRLLHHSIVEYERQIAALFRPHPDAFLFESLPGAGEVIAPRLLTAFGTDRSRHPTAQDMQTYAGVAPVVERSGKSCWTHWRWNCPKFLRQTFHEFAKNSIPYSAWAKAYYDQQKSRGKGHNAAIRALAFKWVRIIHRCWLTRTPYDEGLYLQALAQRGSPLCALIAAPAREA